MRVGFACLPRPLQQSLQSLSVVERCVAFDHRAPRKLWTALRQPLLQNIAHDGQCSFYWLPTHLKSGLRFSNCLNAQPIKFAITIDEPLSLLAARWDLALPALIRRPIRARARFRLLLSRIAIAVEVEAPVASVLPEVLLGRWPRLRVPIVAIVGVSHEAGGLPYRPLAHARATMS